jgi:cephalosporin hydroxylase
MSEAQEKIKECMITASELNLTDKADYHAYEEIYPQLLEKFYDKEVNILEVGTERGGGLHFLCRAFEKAKVYGLDQSYHRLEINQAHTNNLILLSESDQTSAKILEDPLFPDPGLDLVIEDASHVHHLSIATFELLEPKLNSGAVYIIEDVYPEYLELYQKDERFTVHDIRELKGRGDDIIAVYEKE